MSDLAMSRSIIGRARAIAMLLIIAQLTIADEEKASQQADGRLEAAARQKVQQMGARLTSLRDHYLVDINTTGDWTGGNEGLRILKDLHGMKRLNFVRFSTRQRGGPAITPGQQSPLTVDGLNHLADLKNLTTLGLPPLAAS